MNIDKIITEVKAIRDTLAPIVKSTHVMPAVLASLEAQKAKSSKLARKAKRDPWTLVIPPSSPLTFVPTADDTLIKHEMFVDLSCSLSEPDSAGIPLGPHNIAVRVWSTDLAICFRDEVDAERLRERVHAQGKRVMLRFHFDHAEKGQEGPRHHLQLGGKGSETDYQWQPTNWKLPRFLHLPVNLALACEFIGKNFYPKRYSKLGKEPGWHNAVREAECAYIFPFLRRFKHIAVDEAQRSDSLLSLVWNV